MFKRKKNYNLMVLMGIDKKLSDSDFIEEHGLPKELAHKPEMNFWMTFKVLIGNINAGDSPQDILRLFNEQCQRMRELFPDTHWECSDFSFKTYTNEEIFQVSKSIYERYNGEVIVPDAVNLLKSKPSVSKREAFYFVAFGEQVKHQKVMIDRSTFGTTLSQFVEQNFPGNSFEQVGHVLAQENYKSLMTGVGVNINLLCTCIGCLLDDPTDNVVFVGLNDIRIFGMAEDKMDRTLNDTQQLEDLVRHVMQ
jgi:hypothetical protein